MLTLAKTPAPVLYVAHLGATMATPVDAMRRLTLAARRRVRFGPCIKTGDRFRPFARQPGWTHLSFLGPDGRLERQKETPMQTALLVDLRGHLADGLAHFTRVGISRTDAAPCLAAPGLDFELSLVCSTAEPLTPAVLDAILLGASRLVAMDAENQQPQLP